MKRVSLLPRTTQPGFEVWWLNPPYPLTWDRDGIRSSTWLASRISRDDALALAVVEGWEVVG
jgi:hypothetical protein